MIMAGHVVQHLKRKAEATGSLNRVTLRMQELQDVVGEGKDENDRIWLNLPWSDVETSHAARLKTWHI